MGGYDQLLATMRDFGNSMHERNMADFNAELSRRDSVIKQLESFADDDLNDTDLRTQAHQQAVLYRGIPPTAKFPKEAQFDQKRGHVPIVADFLVAQNSRGKEPRKPPEPAKPTEPPTPPWIGTDAGGPPPSIGAIPPVPVAPPVDPSLGQSAPADPMLALPSLMASMPSQATDQSAQSAPLPVTAPAIPAQPGGAHIGPNQITTAPAIGGGGGVAATAAPVIPPPPLPAADADPVAAAEAAQYPHGVPPEIRRAHRQAAIQHILTEDKRDAAATALKAKLTADLAKHNLIPVFDADGNYVSNRPATDAEMDPVQRQKVSQSKAMEQAIASRQIAQQAQAAWTSARTDDLKKYGAEREDFNRIRAHAAELQAEARMKGADVAISNNSLARQRFERDTYATVNGTPVPGALVDSRTGAPVGANSPLAKAQQPTAADRTRATQGKQIIETGNHLIQLINENQDAFGPWNGRFNEATLEVGSADPRIREIFANLETYANLQPQLHLARGKGYKDDFIKAVGQLKDNPESVIAAINALNLTAGGFVSRVSNMPTVQSGDTTAVLQTINRLKKTKNPKTGVNYTEKEIRDGLAAAGIK